MSGEPPYDWSDLTPAAYARLWADKAKAEAEAKPRPQVNGEDHPDPLDAAESAAIIHGYPMP